MAARLLRPLVEVEDGELRALGWSFLFHFALLSGYFIMRPLRDEMGIAGGTGNLPALFTATFVSMLLLVPLYSWLVARVPRRRLVALVYRFFLVNLLAFFALWRAGVAPQWVARVFFVWVSVYNVFVVSVFWSVMADSWRSDQGKRLFGFIAAGGSLGAIAGPLLTAALAGAAGVPVLILISAALLELAARCAGKLPSRGSGAPTGGGLLDGFRRALASPFLLGICLQVLLYGVTSTFIYLAQADLMARHVGASASRIGIFALQDLFVNSLTAVLQAGVTGRIVVHLGLAVSLAIVPIATFGGFLAILLAPGVLLVAAIQAGRRVLHFAFDRPSREVLFTAVAREDRFKSKSFIDNIVFRGGDAVGGWLHHGLAAAATPVGLPLSVAWLAVAVVLARAHEAHARSPRGEATP